MMKHQYATQTPWNIETLSKYISVSQIPKKSPSTPQLACSYCVGFSAFPFFENVAFHLPFRSKIVSRNTLLTFMSKLIRHVEDKNKRALSESFSEVLDWCSASSTHYVSILATIPSKVNDWKWLFPSWNCTNGRRNSTVCNKHVEYFLHLALTYTVVARVFSPPLLLIKPIPIAHLHERSECILWDCIRTNSVYKWIQCSWPTKAL